MRILVIGGAGYVGSHAARFLHDAGHEVWVYDNLSTGHREAALADRMIQGDLADHDLLVDTMQGLDTEAVMHFAAFSLVGESVTDPAKYYRNNVVNTITLLDAMRAANVNRLVFSSTTATYGEPEHLPITEDCPQAPINPYGMTKWIVEKTLADYSQAYGLGYAALRYFNAAGASASGEIGEDHSPETHLIPLVLQVALGQRDHISIFGDDYPTRDGTCVRDYVHVEDLASAHLAALDRLESGKGLCLNLGSESGYSVREVIDACRQVTGHMIPAVMADRRPGDSPELIADATRAKRTLNWQPRYTDILPIVETAWRWHERHPQGYSAAGLVSETANA